MINELLREKYRKFIFYCHNLGGYDIVFILKVLLTYKESTDADNKFKINTIIRDGNIISISDMNESLRE